MFGGDLSNCRPKKYVLFASVARCTNVSTAQSGQTNMSNIRSIAFDFQQTGFTLQTSRTIITDRGSFMLVDTTLFEGTAKVMCALLYLATIV